MKKVLALLILSALFAAKAFGEIQIDLTTAEIESVSSDTFRIHHLTLWEELSPSYTVDLKFDMENRVFVPRVIAEEPSSLPYPTNSSSEFIDLSLATYYISNNDLIEIGHVAVTGYPGTYKGWFQVDPVNQVLVLADVKEETFNLPPGFPMNVPGGTYEVSGEWCIDDYCVPVSGEGLKNDDYSQFAWSADPFVSGILYAACPGDPVEIRYEPYANGSFSATGTTSCHGYSTRVTLTFTKVSNIVWYQ